MKTFYVTTPIYYANGAPHLGGAYTTIAADVLARWNRFKGKDVFFLTGTDEHGQKIQEVAEKAGKKPKEFVDGVIKEWKKAFKLLNVSNDYFIRTTNPDHEKEVQKMLQELYDKGLIYKGNYESYYCVGCEQYLTKKDLVDGKCPLHKRVPELKKEEAYLFKLSKFQDKLFKLIKTGKYEILPKKRRKEILTFIEGGLEDVSISRLKKKISWGIPLPFDKEHCAWVWPDAFWNYVSGLKINNQFEKFWPADVQLMAKDIFRVHATIWPALLLGLNMPLPKTLVIHGYFTINGHKMSKSLGNVLDPIELSEKYGADAVRYFMMRNIAFGEDGDVSEKALVERYNGELANKLGNLVSRVAGLIEKNGVEKIDNKFKLNIRLKKSIENGEAKLGTDEEGALCINQRYRGARKGRVSEVINTNLLSEHPGSWLEAIELFVKRDFELYQLDKALNTIFAFIDHCNWFIQVRELWKTKDKKILFELKESILKIAELLSVFIPESADKITKQFSAKQIKKGEVLFKKIEWKE